MKFKLVMVIVNAGFSDDVMSAAREVNAKGGTIVSARGTGKAEAEERFNITVQPEKEIVFIVAAQNIVEDLLKNVYKKVGLGTPGQGIAFTLPIDDFVKTKIDRPEITERGEGE